MAQPKALASLSSGLLARKGGARPAMRPQGFGGGFGNAHGPLDDLGWNDMGALEAAAMAVSVPPVLVEREALKETFAAPVVEEAVVEIPAELPRATKSVSVATATRIGRESAKQTRVSKAAFTLRLDGERHLRLRLASAVTNQSSQALVAQALDIFLQSLPEVELLIAQLPPMKTPKTKTGAR